MNRNTAQPDNSLMFIIFVTLMGMLFLLPSDIYLPAMPLMQHYFNTSTAMIQMTLSIFFLGSAISQVIVGPLIDRFDLRAIGILALSIFIISSLCCMFAESINQLIIARFIQASAAGFSAVISRAVVTKNFEPARASHVFMIMSPILAVSPAVAPIIGGVLTKFVNWQAIFGFTVILSSAILLLAFRYLVVKKSELLPHYSIHPLAIAKSYGMLMSNRSYTTYLLTRCGVDAAYFAYITASPFLFHQLGYSAEAIGNFYMPLIITFVGTSYLAKRLMDKFSKDTLMLGGLIISILGGGLLLMIGLNGYQNAYQIIVPAAIMTAGYGFTGSLSWAEAMSQVQPHQAGLASSLIGFFPMLAASITAMLVNILTHSSASLLAIFMMVVLASVALLLIQLIYAKQTDARKNTVI